MSDIRTRILNAAERCFYEEGLTATGVDTLAAEAGVSKRTLYNHFASKDEVITAYLQRREERWRERLSKALEGATTPSEQIVSYVRSYCEHDDLHGYRGCPFINASAELADPDHPGVAVIQESVSRIERDIADILKDAGIRDANEVARQILLVLEGASSVSGVRRNGDAYDTAELLVRSLVEGLGRTENLENIASQALP